MTPEELALIESKFKDMEKVFETELKASETLICSKLDSFKLSQENDKKSLDFCVGDLRDHIKYHSSVSNIIVKYTVKSFVIMVFITSLLTFILSTKGGLLTTVLSKFVGL